MFEKYCQKLFFFLVLLILPVAGNWLYLKNSGELLSVDEIARIQQSSANNNLVGLATRNQFYYYKKAIYQITKPKVLILGSSRVMEFRKESFKSSITNAGGAMNSINEGYSFIKEAFAANKPDLVILGLDYWWFNEIAHKPLQDVKPPLKLNHHISLRSYLLPFSWLWQNKISISQYVEMLNPFLLFKNDYENGIGVDAIVNNTGFSKDGSFVYTKTINGHEKCIDEKFHLCLENLRTGGLRFQYGDKVHDLHFTHLVNMINEIKKQGTELIIFIPPNAPTIVSSMKSYESQFKYITDLTEKLTKMGLKVHNFHDPENLKSSDCEFLDGIHGGEITYVKILRQLALAEPALLSHVNLEYLAWVESKGNNLAMIPMKGTSDIEVDFLKIGCDKSAQHNFRSFSQA